MKAQTVIAVVLDFLRNELDADEIEEAASIADATREDTDDEVWLVTVSGRFFYVFFDPSVSSDDEIIREV